jgi:hypothetical protein
MDEFEHRALNAEYLSVKDRLRLLRVGFWIAAVLGIVLVCVGELWLDVGVWVGAALLFSAATIWILRNDFIRGPVQRQRRRVEAATDADHRTP